ECDLRAGEVVAPLDAHTRMGLEDLRHQLRKDRPLGEVLRTDDDGSRLWLGAYRDAPQQRGKNECQTGNEEPPLPSQPMQPSEQSPGSQLQIAWSETSSPAPGSTPKKRATKSLAGAARISVGVPSCTSSPSDSTATRSASRNASSTSWVTSTTV